MSKTFTPVTPELHDYILSVTLREPDVLRRLREHTASLPESSMQIAPEQGQLMALLVQLIEAVNCIEVGVYTGYSALSVARALPENGKIVACDVNAEWTRVARKYWEEAGVAHKIELVLAPAEETLQRLLDKGREGRFDFMFIDADKQNYHKYYETGLRLVRPGGLIAFDNVLWDGEVINPETNDADTQAIRRLNESLLKDERVDISLIPIADGLTLARKR